MKLKIKMTINELYETWYKRKPVLFELVKPMRGREVAFLRPKNETDLLAVRGIKAHKVDFLIKNMMAFQFLKRKFNIYISCALLENMPMFTFNYKKRREDLKNFRGEFVNYMVGYDLLLDFDSKHFGFERCLEETRAVKRLFDDYKLPYYILFSGSGFHIKIPSRYIPGLKGTDKTNQCKLISSELSSTLSLASLDLGIYDMRRVAKVPYSIDSKTDNVAWPLTDSEIINFNVDDMHISRKINMPLTNRGVFLRNDKSNLDLFMDEVVNGS